jgi:Zn-dependent membrane protease YugP
VALAGMLLGMAGLARAGVVLFAAGVLFGLATLPVEFDASRRAMRALTSLGLVARDEQAGTKAVLDAAAWRYAAGFVCALFGPSSFVLRMAGLPRNAE